MSTASQIDDSAPDEGEFGPASESSRPTEPRSWPVPTPPMRDKLSTLELEELDDLGADTHFDFHDTIPAPPWLGEFADAENEPPPLPPLLAR
ncbi:MAG: hypothetical protein ABIQ16_05165 [Polyangiaceae bacterium]